MKRIIPVYIFQQVNVLLVSLYLLKFLCIGELTILQVLYGASLFSFLWMYGNMAERFWENLSIILAERNISWIELTRKMFAGEFHYPSELNRLYQKIRH
ncbi:Tn5253 hypothetical protein [Streptococcus pneumoniae]|nr:Tn5253 hypothetical protein [Streptococcus pneumoniae]